MTTQDNQPQLSVEDLDEIMDMYPQNLKKFKDKSPVAYGMFKERLHSLILNMIGEDEEADIKKLEDVDSFGVLEIKHRNKLRQELKQAADNMFGIKGDK